MDNNVCSTSRVHSRKVPDRRFAIPPEADNATVASLQSDNEVHKFYYKPCVV